MIEKVNSLSSQVSTNTSLKEKVDEIYAFKIKAQQDFMIQEINIPGAYTVYVTKNPMRITITGTYRQKFLKLIFLSSPLYGFARTIRKVDKL